MNMSSEPSVFQKWHNAGSAFIQLMICFFALCLHFDYRETVELAILVACCGVLYACAGMGGQRALNIPARKDS